MATYSRVKTFVANETLTASDLNAEFNNIITNTNSGNLNSDNVSTSSAWTWTGYHTYSTSSRIALSDDIYMTLGNATDGDYRVRYNATSTALEIMSTDSDGAGTDAVVLDIQDGTDDLRLRGGFSTDNNTAPTSGIVTGGNIVSDTDGTDDLGTTSVRWANLYVDAATITNNLTVGGTLTLTGGLTLNGNVTVGDSASDTLTINSTITSNLLFTDATYDIGASGATRPRDLFLSRNAVMGGTLGVTGLITASGGVSGALTGNVTGDVTGDVTGNLTGNVTGNVTGNLTGDVTGNISGNVTGGTISGTTGTFSGDFAINTSTLKVDTSNNRVGVKNASPSYPLDIGYTAGINQVAWRGSTNEIGFLTFGSSTDAGAVQLSSGGAAKILFDAAGNSYIHTGSNFGIGTSSPTHKLSVLDTSGSVVRLQGISSYNYDIESQGDGTLWDHEIGSGNAKFSWSSSSAELMRLDSTGLGIGTSSPVAQNVLTLQDNTNGYVGIRFNGTGSYAHNWSLYGSGDGAGNEFFGLYDATNGAYRLKVTENGDVAIGRAPYTNYRFTVQSADTSSSTYAIQIQNSLGYGLIQARSDGQIATGTYTLSPYNNTTASAANMHVNSSGILYRSTSSAKYKTGVETIEDSYADAILNMRPVWYRSLSEADNANHGWWGFIAEEVAEIDPRLVQYRTTESVISEESGKEETVTLDEPIPEGVSYDRFVPLLLNLIQRQQQSIATLETKVAALEAA